MEVNRKFSTRLLRKGALIGETYRVFQHWDSTAAVRDNLDRIRQTNPIGASNESWLREVVATLSSRLADGPDVAPFVILAKADYPLAEWKQCFLWFIGQTDGLYYRFATEWLFEAFSSGRLIMRTEDVEPYVRQVTKGRLDAGLSLSEYGCTRAARDLLKTAADFGLLKGGPAKEFATLHMTDDAFLFVLHAIAQTEQNARQIVQSTDWRLFLMTPNDVEQKLYDLHQYQKVNYQAAGTLATLDLPRKSPLDFIKELVHE